MAIASRKSIFTMMDAEMLLITHVYYQPIVAPLTIRVDEMMLSRAIWPRIAACSGFLEASGTISV